MTKDKWGTNMVPPRLTLVKSEPESEEDAGLEAARVAAAEAEMRSLQVEEARVAELAAAERRQKLRILEAALFAASEPLDEARLLGHLTADAPVGELLSELQEEYAARGVNLVRVAGKWAFRTAEDLSYLLERYQSVERRLSKAALETLSIIAYHQPVTRAEVEEIRGVSTSAGTLDILLETGWVRPRGRRRAPGRPVTYGTTEAFLEHFGLDSIRDLPGLAELKGAGLLDSNLPPGFTVPEPSDVAALMPDELPLDAADEETAEEAEAAPEATPDLLDTDDNDKSEPSGA
jgi:segregation and condensation protein B